MMEITCTMAVAAEAETDRLCRAVLRIFALRHGIGGQLHGSIGNDLGIWILVGSVAAGQKKGGNENDRNNNPSPVFSHGLPPDNHERSLSIELPSPFCDWKENIVDWILMSRVMEFAKEMHFILYLFK
jgi:hypothetical protein